MQYEYIRDGLPHYHHIGATFAVTTQLADAISRPALQAMQEQYQGELSRFKSRDSPGSILAISQFQNQYESRLEQLLHADRKQEHLLRNPVAAKILVQKILQYDQLLYRCEAFSIMSNHLHLLLDFSVQLPKGFTGQNVPSEYKNLEDVMRLVKGGSAFKINKALDRKGPVWRPAYYNRYIRDEKHWKSAYWYILNNPVQAGLVQRWQDHPFTYAAEGSYARLSRL